MSAAAPAIPSFKLPENCPPELAASIRALNPGYVFVQFLPAKPGAPAPLALPAAGASNETLTLIGQLIEGALEVGVPILFPIASPLLPYFDLVVKNGVPWLMNLIAKKPTVERWTLAMLEAEPPAARPLP